MLSSKSLSSRLLESRLFLALALLVLAAPALGVGLEQAEIVGLATKCLDVRGGSTAEGADVILFRCHGGENQRWDLPVRGFTGEIVGVGGLCLDIRGRSATSRAPRCAAATAVRPSSGALGKTGGSWAPRGSASTCSRATRAMGRGWWFFRATARPTSAAAAGGEPVYDVGSRAKRWVDTALDRSESAQRLSGQHSAKRNRPERGRGRKLERALRSAGARPRPVDHGEPGGW
ncbi:MAG: ricin-type beta-trefoil lectin domain protein [Thermoanaerobaculia bacterium]|nr:ricin-type beta-trefoil lectin domain protein [Thermoanaerobaculia bacterium]